MTLVQCPACKSRKNYGLHRWREMPLSILRLPKTASGALAASTQEIDLRRCAACGHVYHTQFDAEKVTYEDDTTMVFNKGPAWLEHQATLAHKWIERFELATKKVLEIGCGEGGFLEHFMKARCSCVGFEPGRDASSAEKKGIRVIREKFEASQLANIRPSAIICRHVIEHLSEPLDFLQDIALTSTELGIDIVLLAEVPRIDKALAQNRISDFIHEHISHFTESSFRKMLHMAGFDIVDFESRYGDEVIVAAARPKKGLQPQVFKEASLRFGDSIQRQTTNVQKKIDEWSAAGKRVALWGGAGKAATLINMLGFTKTLFPIVVDSDAKKFGHFVPGTGQEIRSPSYLKEHPVDGILICTNWRARDIEKEIRSVHRLEIPLFVLMNEKIIEITPDVAL